MVYPLPPIPFPFPHFLFQCKQCFFFTNSINSAPKITESARAIFFLSSLLSQSSCIYIPCTFFVRTSACTYMETVLERWNARQRMESRVDARLWSTFGCNFTCSNVSPHGSLPIRAFPRQEIDFIAASRRASVALRMDFDGINEYRDVW